MVPGRLLGQGKFKSLQDMYCGVSILALYFLYLTVVKGALSVFDCSKVGCMPARVACALVASSLGLCLIASAPVPVVAVVYCRMSPAFVSSTLTLPFAVMKYVRRCDEPSPT